MIKVILFDCDGVIVKEREKYFRHRMKDEFGININEAVATDFFRNDFLLCETGKLDLKVELAKQLPIWNISWPVEEVLKYWFEGEAEKDQFMVEEINSLRKQGVKCYLTTNNEKYRVEYLTNTVGLGKILDGIFSSAGVGYLKPDPNFWHEVFKRLQGYKKDEILVFDNQKHLVDSAKEFGFKAEFFTTFENFKQQLTSYEILNGKSTI
jgi:putative hydrolase of the HAD superfamily